MCRITFLTFFSFTLLLGCATSSNHPYESIIKNISDEKIRKAHVIFDDIVFPGGVVSPGVTKSTSPTNVPIPEIATVQWETLDGVFHKKEVRVRNKLPSREREEFYRIYFKISGDNVEVEITTYQYPELPN